jgi:hypothetical protein
MKWDTSKGSWIPVGQPCKADIAGFHISTNENEPEEVNHHVYNFIASKCSQGEYTNPDTEEAFWIHKYKEGNKYFLLAISRDVKRKREH